jgi:hypothetical protein
MQVGIILILLFSDSCPWYSGFGTWLAVMVKPGDASIVIDIKF